MTRRRNDHDIAAEIVALLESDEDKARHPDMEARSLIQQAIDAGGGGLRTQYLKQAQRAIAKLNPARHGRLINELQGQVLALQGRRGDSRMAHVTLGEVVVPPPLQTPEVLAALQAATRQAGIDPARLIVGDRGNSINPRTGQPEFGFMDWMSGLFRGQSTKDGSLAAPQGAAQGAANAGHYPGKDIVEFIPDAIGADIDLARNYFDMRRANTIGADKYFHCKGNCEAATRGPGGVVESGILSELRELTDQHIQGDSREASDADREANTVGRQGGANNPDRAACRTTCGRFRPNGLPSNY